MCELSGCTSCLIWRRQFQAVKSGQVGNEQQNQRQEGASSPQTLSRCRHESKSVTMVTAEHTQLRARSFNLSSKTWALPFFFPVYKIVSFISPSVQRGREFVLPRSVCFNMEALSPLDANSAGMPQGFILGPPFFFTLDLWGPLTYLILAHKLSHRTQLNVEVWLSNTFFIDILYTKIFLSLMHFYPVSELL